jgi:hypothetical protein
MAIAAVVMLFPQTDLVAPNSPRMYGRLNSAYASDVGDAGGVDGHRAGDRH